MENAKEAKMAVVTVESPFKSDIPQKTVLFAYYAQLAMLDCMERGEVPFASHLLYTQVLMDGKSEEREKGMKMGRAVSELTSKTVAYVDFGISEGMRKGILDAKWANRPIEERRLFPDAISHDELELLVVNEASKRILPLPTAVVKTFRRAESIGRELWAREPKGAR